MNDLKGKTITELQDIITACVSAIYSQNKYVAYSTDGDCGWARTIKTVNIYTLNGWGVTGDHLAMYKSNLVPRGCLVLEVYGKKKYVCQAVDDCRKELKCRFEEWWLGYQEILPLLGELTVGKEIEIKVDESLKDED